ncbi:5'/3'-nucleotidase SurE [Candidatus Odyssella thessalonicensis]|uniref:5'/3'-nucleotidase SurE n=1 Tax=Candidatus Odyssella thessalonicensis TaxID=84647 RepID=UPI000225BAE3|nr:5'/3'-nucleotidase SurE [Candidatus Odyssella thessalonicensis]
MRILISNDDGINAPGLQVLESIARQLSDDVWIVAPELDQSGASHSLTLRDPLRMREISDRKFALSGTPTDCVLFGINHLLKDKAPDLVLSGVNYGANLAEDITYSGTVAAAMEASLLHVPAIAISLCIDKGNSVQWLTVEHFMPSIISQIISVPMDHYTLVNINIPNASINSINGIKVTCQGQRTYQDQLHECIDPRGKKYFWVGIVDHDGSGAPGTDLEAINHNFISVTPLTLNYTHEKSLNRLNQLFLKDKTDEAA